MSKDNKCRCGYSGKDDEHPCHGDGYVCKNPSLQRFYSPKIVSLAGMQMKFDICDTWACDECWDSFKKLLEE